MSGTPGRPLEVIDRFRKQLHTDYLDSLLIHCASTGTWPEERKRVMDAFEEARDKGIILSKGVSCHGLPALTRATRVPWVDVQLVRLNPLGHRVDGATHEWGEPGDVPAVIREVRAMRAQGRGIIGMKLVGDGDFTHPGQREQSIRFAVRSGLLDAAVIGSICSSAEAMSFVPAG